MNLKVFSLNENRHLDLSSVTSFRASYADGRTLFWIGVTEPDPEGLTEFLSPLKLHPLVMEGYLDTTSGTRIAPFENSLFIRLPVQLDWKTLEHVNLTVICLPQAVITIHESPIPALEGVAADFSTAVRFHAFSISAILYQILDRLIDEDMEFVIGVRREVDTLEEVMEKDENSLHIDEILTFKRRVARLAITLEDQHYCMTAMKTIESDAFDITDFREYFRDSLNNLEYAIRSVGRLQAHLTELRTHYLLTLQDRTNKRLRLLTIISAVFMPLTLIAGIYGMNFLYMPELKWHYSYPIVIALMFAIAGGLLYSFYRRGWFR